SSGSTVHSDRNAGSGIPNEAVRSGLAIAEGQAGSKGGRSAARALRERAASRRWFMTPPGAPTRGIAGFPYPVRVLAGSRDVPRAPRLNSRALGSVGRSSVARKTECLGGELAEGARGGPAMSPLLRRARRYPTFLSLAALAILPRLALAGADRFTPFGPGEGYLTRLTAAPSGDLYVTAGFGSSEIWKRKAGASSWTWASRGLERQDVTALAVHPKIPSALWAAAAPASGGFVSIYRSTDAAATWRRVFTGDIDFQVVLLSVVPASSGSVLLAVTAQNGNFDRLLRSANGGASWTEIPGVEPPIAAAPDEPGTVYAWDPAARRIAKSTDGARTFRLTGAIALKPADEILALHATYGRPASVFASFRGSFSAGGLYRSGDGGGHWNRVAFAQAGALDVTSEPGNPRRVLALRRDGISASDQAGRGGTFRPLVFFSPAEIAADPFSLAAVLGGPYLSAGGDLFRPVSSSRSERVSERGIEAFGVSALAFHPLDPSHVALETFHGCIRDFC